MKRINRKEWERLQALHAKLADHFDAPSRQSALVWRGDYRAIQWACWWIRETLAESRKGDQ